VRVEVGHKIVERHDADTYRVVFTVEFEKAIWILHAFKKKSTSGIGAPRKDISTVEKRLKAAREEYTRLYDERE
jgi:phage-related protein